MCQLDRKNLVRDFQSHILGATTKEEMLDASMSFIAIHGGFSDSPESRRKFKDSISVVISS